MSSRATGTSLAYTISPQGHTDKLAASWETPTIPPRLWRVQKKHVANARLLISWVSMQGRKKNDIGHQLLFKVKQKVLPKQHFFHWVKSSWWVMPKKMPKFSCWGCFWGLGRQGPRSQLPPEPHCTRALRLPLQVMSPQKGAINPNKWNQTLSSQQ